MQIELFVFDLNGTLLDMSVLDPPFLRIFDSPLAREAWFEELQDLWARVNRSGAYEPFDKLAQQALLKLAADAGKTVTPADEEAILPQLTKLPAFADVCDGLAKLRKGGQPIVALTNGTLRAARSQLAFANMSPLIDGVFSAGEVGRYKPDPAPYLHALKTLGVAPALAMLVAAHAWDIAGAKAVGMKTAFLRRPGKTLRAQDAKPDLEVADLNALAEKFSKEK